jgi:hypothetical protein
MFYGFERDDGGRGFSGPWFQVPFSHRGAPREIRTRELVRVFLTVARFLPLGVQLVAEIPFSATKSGLCFFSVAPAAHTAAYLGLRPSR